MIDFTLTKKQQELKEGLNQLGRYVIRPSPPPGGSGSSTTASRCP